MAIKEELLKKIEEGRQYRPMSEKLRAKTEDEEPKKDDEATEGEDTSEEETPAEEEPKEDEKRADEDEEPKKDDEATEDEEPAEDEKPDEGEDTSEEETPAEGEAPKEDEKRGGYIVTGHACTFNEPYCLYDDGEYRIDEQVDPAAFEACDMSDVIFQYNHEGRVFARTRNNTLTVSTDDSGLLIEADLGGTETGRALFEEIKGGYTDRMSFGFTVDEDKIEETEDKENGKYRVLRTITKIRKLYDVSAVSIPANDGTDISARSFVNGVLTRAKTVKAERLYRARIDEALTILTV